MNDTFTGSGSAVLLNDVFPGVSEDVPVIYDNPSHHERLRPLEQETNVVTGPDDIAVHALSDRYWHITPNEHTLLRISLRKSSKLISRGRLRK